MCCLSESLDWTSRCIRIVSLVYRLFYMNVLNDSLPWFVNNGKVNCREKLKKTQTLPSSNGGPSHSGLRGDWVVILLHQYSVGVDH